MKVLNKILEVVLIVSLAVGGRGKTTKIAIIGTNDIHGTAFPTYLRHPDKQTVYAYGGLEYLGGAMSIIAEQYKGKSLYLDAGDQFQGGIQSSSLVSHGRIMNDFFQALHLDGAALGNHQFDNGPQFLTQFLNQRHAKNLAANLQKQQLSIPNVINSQLFTLDDNIKIGVIGISTIETQITSNGFVSGLFKGYHIAQYKQKVIAQAQSLKSQGANAVLLLAHAGNACETDQTYGIWSADSIQTSCQQDQISTLLKSLPPKTIHGVIQGHRHQFAHHFIEDVPVMGTNKGGYYFNVLYLTFQNGFIQDTTIEGPIPGCEKVFSNLRTCRHLKKTEKNTAGVLIPWQLHGKTVVAHPAVKYMFQTKWLPKIKPYLKDLAVLQTDLSPSHKGQSALQNLFTTMMMKVRNVDFSLINSGAFRSVWYPKTLQYRDLFDMMPFQNNLVVFEIKGKELMMMLQTLQSGNKGLYHSAGLISLIQKKHSYKLINATFSNGSEINPQTVYTGITIDFLIKGGDDFANVINKTYTPVIVETIQNARTIFAQQLKILGNIKKKNLVDLLSPRIKLTKTY